MLRMSKRVVEVLTFAGCPHGEAAVALAERILAEMAVDTELRRVDVPDAEAAIKERFLGSPTIRLDGNDIDPAATERDDYVLSCRVYRTSAGVSGQPDEQWLRDALAR
jgi:glutaredoxin